MSSINQTQAYVGSARVGSARVGSKGSAPTPTRIVIRISYVQALLVGLCAAVGAAAGVTAAVVLLQLYGA